MLIPGLKRQKQGNFKNEDEDDLLDRGLPQINQWENNREVQKAIAQREMVTHVAATGSADPFEYLQTVDNMYQLNLDRTAKIRNE